jgi:hypothetical protein
MIWHKNGIYWYVLVYTSKLLFEENPSSKLLKMDCTSTYRYVQVHTMYVPGSHIIFQYRQRIGFNDISIEAGILLWGNGIFQYTFPFHVWYHSTEFCLFLCYGTTQYMLDFMVSY